MSLTKKLYLGYILLVVLPISIFSYVVFKYYTANLRAEFYAELSNDQRVAEFIIQKELNAMQSAAVSISSESSFSGVLFEDNNAVAAKILEEKASFHKIDSVVFLRKNSKFVAKSTFPYKNSRGYTFAEFENKAFKGEVVSGIEILNIQRQQAVFNKDLGKDAYSYTSVIPVYSYGNKNAEGILVLRKLISGSSIIADLDGKSTVSETTVNSFDSKNPSQKLDEEDSFYISKKIADINGKKTIVLKTGKSKILFKKILKTSKNFVFGVLVFVFMSLFMVKSLIRSTVVKPAEEIADRVNRYVQGDKTTQMQAGSTKEFQELADAFNRMISDVEASNKEIQESERLLSSVFNLASIGICLYDSAGRHYRFNNAYEKMFGYVWDELVGRHFKILLPEKYLQRVDVDFNKLTSGEKEFLSYDVAARKKTGENIHILLNANVVELNGKTYVLAACTDMTDIKAFEKQSIEHQQMIIQQSKLAAMGEMLGNIAHQWRQPLTAIGMVIQDIEDAYNFDELNEEYIHRFKKDAMSQVTYMSKTIDDFRNFFKPEKEKIVFNLCEVMTSVVALFLPQMKREDIAFELFFNDVAVDISGATLPCSRELVKIYGYPNELKQVILNMLSNARDAVITKLNEDNSFVGKITINVVSTDTRVKIKILDNGGGVPAHIIDRIYEPYFTTKEEGKGTGIGLYMSKLIIENNMNGQIGIVNTESGACFTLKLNRSS